MSSKLTIIFEKDNFGYYCYCPVLPGCQSQGDTFEEARTNIKEALDIYFSTLPQVDAIEMEEIIAELGPPSINNSEDYLDFMHIQRIKSECNEYVTLEEIEKLV